MLGNGGDGTPRSGQTGRASSLDGLRGLAAVLVVFGHLVNGGSPALALAGLQGHPVKLSGFERFVEFTPVHVLFAGGEAVIIFFVLSGFVLALPIARGRTFSTREYYPRRFVRLYVPVWGALVVAALVHLAVTRDPNAGATWWLNDHAVDMTAGEGIKNVTLVGGAGGWQYATPLWSLQWEVLFSILLPAFVALGLAARRAPLLAAGVCLAVILVEVDSAMQYLPCFMLGTILAFNTSHIDRVRTFLAESSRRGALARWALPVVAVLALTSAWWIGYSSVQHRVALCLTAIGASLFVVLALTHRPFEQVLNSRPMQWVGTRSFALYLVHEPIVVACAFALGATPGVALLAAVALPLVVLATEAFYRVVEHPSHELSRRIGHITRARVAPSDA